MGAWSDDDSTRILLRKARPVIKEDLKFASLVCSQRDEKLSARIGAIEKGVDRRKR
jgi:hypothetical protein